VSTGMRTPSVNLMILVGLKEKCSRIVGIAVIAVIAVIGKAKPYRRSHG